MSLEHPIIAIDHGASRIGTAISDPIGIMAHPLETISNNEQAITRILELIQHLLGGCSDEVLALDGVLVAPLLK